MHAIETHFCNSKSINQISNYEDFAIKIQTSLRSYK